eukprot:scaffold547_cov384-Prasinococcus_capsulatus_cf.AAC.4
MWIEPCVEPGVCILFKKPLDRIRERLATRGLVSVLAGGTFSTRVDEVTAAAFGIDSSRLGHYARC